LKWGDIDVIGQWAVLWSLDTRQFQQHSYSPRRVFIDSPTFDMK